MILDVYTFIYLEREGESDNISLVIGYKIQINIHISHWSYIDIVFIQAVVFTSFLPSPPRVFFPYSHCFNRRRFGFVGSGASEPAVSTETVETVRSKDWRSSTRWVVFFVVQKIMEANNQNKGPDEKKTRNIYI